MSNNLVTIHDGKATTTSLKIAEHFKKDHSKVLRAIQAAECSQEFRQANFGFSKYRADGNRRTYPYCCITRDGFMFLVMGFTGKEAAMWKERFISAFNEMEAKLSNQTTSNDIINALRGKTLKMDIGYDGKISFLVKEPSNFWSDIIRAIKAPENIGLEDSTIRDVANACLDALAHRAAKRLEWGNRLNGRIRELEPKRLI